MTFKLWASNLYVAWHGRKEFYKMNNSSGLHVTCGYSDISTWRSFDSIAQTPRVAPKAGPINRRFDPKRSFEQINNSFHLSQELMDDRES
ncbi:hypothetical protein SDJN02_15606, partial [Cucurbita argyrosperma subsp. argyrosperma]